MMFFISAYFTYGRWLARVVFKLNPTASVPAVTHCDNRDFVPTNRSVLFGHHFTSIAGTGPIVGPAIAVMWGWLPALLWVMLGSIFVGAVHDFASLVISVRNQGQTVGEIAGRVLNRRVRVLFLLILFMALTIVLAIFGLVIAAVFKQYPAAIFPCLVQIPIAIGIGVWLHRKNVNLLIPSLLALVTMYVTLVFGNDGMLGQLNSMMAGWSIITWVVLLLAYSYVASVLPVWLLLQPRDYINSLQLISALGLVVVGLVVAGFLGGSPVVANGQRVPLQMVAPAIRAVPPGAPAVIPFLFITIACGACSGFHCLVSSGTSSKQLANETDAQFVAYGSMLTEGFLAIIVVLACVAGLGLGVQAAGSQTMLTGEAAYQLRYASWDSAKGLAATVGAFVDGSANFLKAIGMPAQIAIATMGVLVASFAGTTLDTACRLQRYVIQELAATLLGTSKTGSAKAATSHSRYNPLLWLTNKHGATIFAVLLALVIAIWPTPDTPVTIWQAMAGNLPADFIATHEAMAAPALQGGLAGGHWWLTNFAGRGGLILWPLFGATNQLLAGLAFLVITFYMWRRKMPVWFIAIPMLFMLVVPAWAMLIEIPNWITHDRPNWILIGIGITTLLLECWMVVEAIILWPAIKGVLEDSPVLVEEGG